MVVDIHHITGLKIPKIGLIIGIIIIVFIFAFSIKIDLVTINMGNIGLPEKAIMNMRNIGLPEKAIGELRKILGR